MYLGAECNLCTPLLEVSQCVRQSTDQIPISRFPQMALTTDSGQPAHFQSMTSRSTRSSLHGPISSDESSQPTITFSPKSRLSTIHRCVAVLGPVKQSASEKPIAEATRKS